MGVFKIVIVSLPRLWSWRVSKYTRVVQVVFQVVFQVNIPELFT